MYLVILYRVLVGSHFVAFLDAQSNNPMQVLSVFNACVLQTIQALVFLKDVSRM